MEAILDFVKEVKSSLPESKFIEFFHLLRNFVSQKCDTKSSRSAIEALLQEHDDLILGFGKIKSIADELEASVAPVKAFAWTRQYMKKTESPARCRLETSAGQEDSVMDKESYEKDVRYVIDFVNRVRRTLQDEEKYKLFVRAINGFQAHKKIKKVDREVNRLFAEHPALEIEFSKFRADFSRRKKKKRANSRSTQEVKVFKPRILSTSEVSMFKCEDHMVEMEVLCRSLESAKNAIHAFIMAGQIEPEKVINIKDYISHLNVKCIKELYNEKLKYVQNSAGDEAFKTEEVLVHLRDIETAKKTVRLVDKKLKRVRESQVQDTQKWAKILKAFHEKMQQRGKRIRVRRRTTM